MTDLVSYGCRIASLSMRNLSIPYKDFGDILNVKP